MTICILVHPDTFPVVITDNLISNNGNQESISTPLVDNERRRGVQDTRPAGVANKVWFLNIDNDNKTFMYLIYSGTVKLVQELEQYIYSKLSYSNIYDISFEDIKSFCEEKYSLNPEQILSVIILYKDNKNYISYDSFNAHSICNITNRDNNKCLYIGSGGDCFKETILKKEKIQELLSKEYTDDNCLVAIENSILTGMEIIAELTKDYMRGQDSLFAKKSCGALYHMYCLPKLYGINNQDNCSYIKKGLGQLFIDYDELKREYILTKILITYSDIDNQKIYSTNIDLNEKIRSNGESEGKYRFSIDENKIKKFKIGNLKEELSSNYELDDVKINCDKLIIYIKHPFANNHISYFHNSAVMDVVKLEILENKLYLCLSFENGCKTLSEYVQNFDDKVRRRIMEAIERER